MRVAVYLPLLASLLLALAAPWLARRLPPRTATALLTACGAASAAGTVTALVVLALPLRTPGSPVPPAARLLAAAALGVVTLRGAATAARQLQALAAARALCRRVGGRAGQVVLVDEDVDVFAVPVAGGRVVASRALVDALPAPERQAVFAHEGAHLAHRHHLYRQVAELSAALDPLLRPLPGGVRYSSERWADEDAARAVGDRAVVARALARASLASAREPAGRRWSASRRPAVLARGGSDVVARVQALLVPPPRRSAALVLAVVGVTASGLLCAVHAHDDREAVLHQAQAHAAPASTVLGRGAVLNRGASPAAGATRPGP